MRRAYGKFRKFYAFSFDTSHFIHNQSLHIFTPNYWLFYMFSHMFYVLFKLFTPFSTFLILFVKSHRGKGYATECLNYAKEIAARKNCYKMMLLTGSKNPATLNFYSNAGYNSTDKTAFIQWIE